MAVQYGIVVKTHFPKKQVITILESHGGLMDYVSPTHDVCIGTLINYVITHRSTIGFIGSLEKIDLPLLLARHDLLFFHHILEICYHFVPQAGYMPELFQLLKTLYEPDFNFTKSLHKKIFLVKLFILFGIVPEGEGADYQRFYDAASGAVDMGADEAIILSREDQIDTWLLQCIKMHPHYEQFKTAHYLTIPRNS